MEINFDALNAGETFTSEKDNNSALNFDGFEDMFGGGDQVTDSNNDMFDIDFSEPPSENNTDDTAEAVPVNDTPEAKDNTEEQNDTAATDNDDYEQKQNEIPVHEEVTEEEEKPKKRKKRRTKAETEKAQAEEPKQKDSVNTKEACAEKDVLVIPIDKNLKIDDLVNNIGIQSSLGLEDVHAKIDDLIDNIRIDKNLDPANIMLLNDKIDEVYDLIVRNLPVVQTLYENLTEKDNGIVAITRKINETGDGTVGDRQRNGVLAAMNYKAPGARKTCNLFQAVFAARYEYNFFNSRLNQVENKRRLLKGQSDALSIRK